MPAKGGNSRRQDSRDLPDCASNSRFWNPAGRLHRPFAGGARSHREIRSHRSGQRQADHQGEAAIEAGAFGPDAAAGLFDHHPRHGQ